MANGVKNIINANDMSDLSDRQKIILRTIIHLYILNANPVGSRTLSKFIQKELKLSPATIRNVMSDLEDLNYINHPHTSAGRIPTDKGYRFYVDSLVKLEDLSNKEIMALENTLHNTNSEGLFKEASKILGALSNYLSVVAIPHIVDLKVLKLELISITSNRFLVVIALDSNYVRTVTLEADFEIDPDNLDFISRYINEKISGKSLRFIRDNFKEIILDFEMKDTPLIRLFVDSINYIFEEKKEIEKIHYAGTHNLLDYPEFEDLTRVKGIIELLENEDVIVHLMDKNEENNLQVLIGKEIDNELLQDYSMIVSKYSIGNACGSIGLIGPKRMKYSKMISLVKNVSEYLNRNS